MISNNVLNVIGDTPLILLPSISNEEKNIRVFGKLECINPASSVKDRSALQLIQSAEKSGALKEGYSIVESSSGNMGHALAMICAVKKYKFICVLDPKTPKSNIALVKAFGGSVEIVTEKDESGGYQKNRIKTAKRIAQEMPDCVNLDQYNNNAAMDAHYLHTGPEIYQQLDGDITHFMGCVSTGSHLCGTAKYLKEQKPDVKVIGVEPDGSVIFGGQYKPFLQNGTGLSFTPGNYLSEFVDDEMRVNDREAFSVCHSIARNEGLLLGGSSGSVLHAAAQVAKTAEPNSTIVAILPDGGLKYLNTVYNDEWLASNHLLPLDIT